MSTRATYIIDQTDFYIHHDGYTQGAAMYFVEMIRASIKFAPLDSFNMVDPYACKGGIRCAFIRGNTQAEIIDSFHDIGDTEFHYALKTCFDGEISVTAFSRKPWNTQEWTQFYHGELCDFLRLHPPLKGGAVIRYNRNFNPESPHWHYMSKGHAIEYCTRLNQRAQKDLDNGQTGTAHPQFQHAQEIWKGILASENIDAA